MSGRTYKQKTRSLGIPVHGYKDGIFPEVEMRKWQLVENLLLAATRSVRNCIFDEGTWTIRKIDDTFRVGLGVDSSTAGPAISGVMKGIYFEVGPSIVWKDLKANEKHYLYLAPTSETRFNPRAVRHYARPRRMGLRDEMLVGILDGQTGELEKNPEGKVYSDSMTAPGMMLQPIVIDFESAGTEGFMVNTTRRIAFIQVSRVYKGEMTGSVGDVAVGYYGTDEAVEKSTHAVIYNSGDTGIPMRALVFCG